MKVFVDTAAWIALLNTNDNLYQKALKVKATLQEQKVSLLTTEFILIELADALCKQRFKKKTVAFIENIRIIDNLQIIPISQELLREGLQLYGQRLDKDWGLTDCTSFVVMNKEKITQAFTSDHHFEQAGFIKLL